jgi:hypothetical protein
LELIPISSAQGQSRTNEIQLFDRKEVLQAKLQTHYDPVFFNTHKTVFVRKPNELLVHDALEKARRRFEEQLMLKRLQDV